MMKSMIWLLLSITFSISTLAAISPAPLSEPSPTMELKKLTPKSVEKLTGKKMSVTQKLAFWVWKKKMLKASDEESFTPRQKRQALASMILGLASIGLIFIPYVSILAIPASILAIIFGIKSLKGNSNTKGIIGLVAGGTTLLLVVIAIIVITSTPWF